MAVPFLLLLPHPRTASWSNLYPQGFLPGLCLQFLVKGHRKPCIVLFICFFSLTEALWDITVFCVENVLFVLKCHCVISPYWITGTLFSWFSESFQCETAYCQRTVCSLTDCCLNSTFCNWASSWVIRNRKDLRNYSIFLRHWDLDWWMLGLVSHEWKCRTGIWVFWYQTFVVMTDVSIMLIHL